MQFFKIKQKLLLKEKKGSPLALLISLAGIALLTSACSKSLQPETNDLATPPFLEADSPEVYDRVTPRQTNSNNQKNSNSNPRTPNRSSNNTK